MLIDDARMPLYRVLCFPSYPCRIEKVSNLFAHIIPITYLCHWEFTKNQKLLNV